MSTKRNQFTLYFTDEEFEQLEFDARQAGMDKSPFAKHVILTRGKLKVKALPGNATKEIERLTRINEELQRQVDAFQSEKGKQDVLAGLGSTPARTVDELVEEKFKRKQDELDLIAYKKLQEEHGELKKTLADKEATVNKLSRIDNYLPTIAGTLGTILVNRFPDMMHGVASAANALGGQLGALPAPAAPAPAKDDELSEVEERMLDFGRTVFSALPEQHASQLALLVNTIAAMPPLLAPVVEHAQHLIPQIQAQMNQQHAPPTPAA